MDQATNNWGKMSSYPLTTEERSDLNNWKNKWSKSLTTEVRSDLSH